MKKTTIRRVFALVLTWMMLVPSFAPSVLTESLDLDDEFQIELGGEDIDLPSDDLLILDGIGGLSLDLDDLTLSSNDSSPEPLPFEQTVTFEDVTVRVTAAVGVLPDGSSCRISDVIEDSAAESAREAAEAALVGKALRHHLYHIELLDRDGNPVLPSNGMPLVSIAGLDVTGELRVFAYDKNGSYETDGWMADRKIEFNLSESAIIDIVDVTGEKTVEQEPTDEQQGVDERQPDEQQPVDEQPADDQQGVDEQQPADELPLVDDVPQVTGDVLSVDDVETEQDVQSEDEQQPQQVGEEERPQQPDDEGQDVDEQQPKDDKQQGVDEQQPVNEQQDADYQQDADEQQTIDSQQDADEQKTTDSQQDADEQQTTDPQQDADEQQTTDSQQDADEQQTTDPQQDADNQQTPDPQQDADDQQPADEQQPIDADKAGDEESDQPVGGESAQPSGEELDQPADESTQPIDEESAQPTDEESDQSADEESDEPTAGGSDQPAVGESDQPVDEQPADTEPVQPTDEESAQPSDGESAQPADEQVVQPVTVVFNAVPETAVITVYVVENEETVEPIPAEEDGSFALLPGKYAYSAEAEGYKAIEAVPFTVEESDVPLTISIEMESEETEKAEETEEAEPLPFDQSATVDGVVITVRAEAGAFPNVAELSVKHVYAGRVKQAGEAIEEVRDEGQNVAASYTFDIKVIDPDTQEELQPAEGLTVEVTFALAEAADDNLEANVYHVTGSGRDMTAEKLDTDVDESAETVTATTDGFSLYTVEFTYNNLEYVLEGDTSVALSAILNELGLTGTVSTAPDGVTVSDSSLFDATLVDSEWVIESHRPFSTTEWMKVTISEVVYDITVTDSRTGSGTKTDPYMVDTWADLQDALSIGGTVKLAQDIIGSEENYTLYVPAGESAILDLNGHTLDGSDISQDTEEQIYSGTIHVRGEGATLTLRGSGTIKGSKKMGVVWVTQGGTFNLEGGVITGGNGSVCGGVCVDQSTFNMSGGSITGNTCTTTTWYGAGVSVLRSTFNMSGGSITGNTAPDNGGVWVASNAKFNLSGNSVIRDNTANGKASNVCLAKTDDGRHAVITVDGKLGNKCDVGVTWQGDLSTAFTSGYGENNSDVAPTSFFFSDDGDYKVTWSDANHTEANLVSEGGVTYRRYDTERKRFVTDVCGMWCELKETNKATEWRDSLWYVVKDDFSFGDDRVTVKDDAHLILCDGATLTVPKGITVASGKSLTIYGQVSGTGQLFAGTTSGSDKTCAAYKAGIGSNPDSGAGTIIIHGGKVTATGGDTGDGQGGAGIGGGDNGAGGSITIYGGTVTAKGSDGAAGIGGGYYGAGGTVTICGGRVTANGGTKAPGIGPGQRGDTSGALLKLDFTEATRAGMSVTVSSVDGNVKLLKNFRYYDNGGYVTLAATDDLDPGKLRGKTLIPAQAHAVVIDPDIENGEVTADMASATAGEKVTLTVAPDDGYALDTLTVTCGQTPVAATRASATQYTFTMPDAAVTVTATFADEWTALQHAITNAGTTATTIDVSLYAGSGKEIDAEDDNTALTIAEGQNITLDLNGCTLNRNLTTAKDGGNVITVNNGGKLTVKGSGTITGGNNDAEGGGVRVEGGEFTLTGSAVVSGNKALAGGGVSVIDGSFDMSGSASVSGNTATYDGGGVYVSYTDWTSTTAENASFTLSGSASVSGNTSGGNGGGVYVRGSEAKFTMTGGSVARNTALGNGKGGGVYMDSGSFGMSGSAAVSLNSAKRGGGVYLGGSSASFTMTGSASVLNNNAIEQGGGVHNQFGTFSVSGAPSVTGNVVGGTISDAGLTGGTRNNVYLTSKKTISVAGALSTDTSIGLTMVTPGIFTSGYGFGENGNNAGVWPVVNGTHFFFDDAGAKLVGLKKTSDDDDAPLEAALLCPWQQLQSRIDCQPADANGVTRIQLTEDVTADSDDTALNVSAGRNVEIDLNGRALDRGLTQAKDDGNAVTVNGTLTVTDGAGGGVITGGRNKGNGGGVIVNGTFNMQGGTISGNSAGTYSYGGGVYLNGGTLTLSGSAKITGNSASNGGGVYMGGGTFGMSGSAEISGNTTNNNGDGGGVYVGGGAFEMTGGSITRNTAVDYGYGGGVYVGGGQFAMSGSASISLNRAKRGGGVDVSSGASFTMNGGSITNNTTVDNPNDGGGVYVGGTFSVSGAPNISGNVKGGKIENGALSGGTANNVFLASGWSGSKTVTVAGALSNTVKIGVSMGSLGVVTSGYPTYCVDGDGKPLAAGTYFVSDKGYTLGLNADNEVEVPQHTVSVTITGIKGADGRPSVGYKLSDGTEGTLYYWSVDTKSFTVPAGMDATLTAGTLQAYSFINWEEDNTITGTDAALTISNVTANHNIIAHYLQTHIVVNAAIDGRDWQDGDAFTFNVDPVEADAPAPPQASLEVQSTAANHSVAFGNIPFTGGMLGKTYHYKVTQTKGDIFGIAYDTGEKEVAYEVAERAGGGVIELLPSAVQEVTFTNTLVRPTVNDTDYFFGKVSNLQADVTAAAAEGFDLSYQWYSCDKDGKNRVKLDGEENQQYTLPADLGAGEHYYLCEVTGTHKTSGKATAVDSNVAKANVRPQLVTLTANSRDTDVYDGTEKTVTGFTCSVDGLKFADTVIASGKGTNAGEYKVDFSGVETHVTKDTTGNYVVDNLEFGTLTIKPKAVTITAKDAAKTYDGKALTEPGFTVSALEAGDSHAFTVAMTDASTITNAGNVPNVIATVDGTAVASGVEKRIGNYLVTTKNGTLTVNPASVTVTITGHTNTATYDGKAHTVKGYDVKIDNPLYRETDFTFSGKAEASRTDAGTAKMGLAASQFKNTNKNFKTVTFDVADGWQAVTAIDATVTIAGHTNTAAYDGKEHTVSGYDVKIDNPLYRETDFSFTGRAEASRTDAGTAKMGLAASQFKNTNANFKTVTFDVADGWQEITPAAITITADDKASRFGAELLPLTYAVGGAYVEGDDLGVTLTTAATSSSGVGTYPITVAWNKNPNYTAELTDGTYTITKGDLTVTASGYSGVYDGKAYSITVTAEGTGVAIYYGTEKLTASNYTTAGSTKPVTRTDAGKTTVYYYVVGGNYEAVSGSKGVNITQKSVAVVADDKTKTYGDADPKLTYKVTGLIGSDKLTGSLTRKKGEKVGTYPIRQGTLNASDNYTIAFTGATFTIKARPVKPGITQQTVMTPVGDTALQLAWSKVDGAQGYDVFFRICDGKDNYPLVKTTKKLSCTIKMLRKGQAYKAYVKAWKKEKGRKVYIGKASPTVHCIAGGYNKKHCNAKKVTVKQKKLTLSKGKSKRIEASVTGVKKRREVLHHDKLLRYFSSDKNVATVDANGVVKARGMGTCTITVMANNGVSATVKVTVK